MGVITGDYVSFNSEPCSGILGSVSFLGPGDPYPFSFMTGAGGSSFALEFFTDFYFSGEFVVSEESLKPNTLAVLDI